jgi:hypothetical protein
MMYGPLDTGSLSYFSLVSLAFGTMPYVVMASA